MQGEVAEVTDPLGPLLFEFTGTARGRERTDSDDKLNIGYELAEGLNRRSLEIAERIRRDLKRMLPPGTEIAVEIDYFPGSLEWVGLVVIILEWTARIADNISFIEYVQRAIRFAINRVHRLELRRFSREVSSWQMETEVRPVHIMPSASRLNKPGGGASVSPPTEISVLFPIDMRVVMYLNTFLILVILAILVRGLL